ncbi:glutamate-rich protein 6B [Molossus molossus]|uniref:glutamate-rich protein 6B n=1 Tax=Molossus molossus TaxID=27622 RepID=UPI0017479A2F|nr:glutamate-rich protein 6B [Molossus molossus]
MSAESNQSSGESSLHPPTPSQQSTQTFSSEEEDAKAEAENSKEDFSFYEEEEYLEENEDQGEEQSLEEDEYLEEETSVGEDEYLEEEQSLEEDEHLEEEQSLEEDEHLEEEQSLEEDEHLEEEQSLEEDEHLEEEQSLEEDDYLEEQTYLKGKEYLHEQESLRERNYLQKEKDLKEKKDLFEEEYLERVEFKVSYSSQTSPGLNARSPVAGVSQVTTLFAHPPPIFEPDGKSLYSDMKPSIPFMRGGESLSWRDQGTQTDCTYENKVERIYNRKASLRMNGYEEVTEVCRWKPGNVELREGEELTPAHEEDRTATPEAKPASAAGVQNTKDSPVVQMWKSTYFQPMAEATHPFAGETQSRQKQSKELVVWGQGPAGASRAPVELKLQKNQEDSTTILAPLKVDSEVTKSVSQENFSDGILNEPTDTLEVKDFDENLLKSSYESVFRTMVKEMAAENELEEDIDIPLTGHLESETRRKLGILLKRDFENYKETFQWILKKRENLFSFKTAETVTYSFHFWSQSPQIEEPETEVEKPRMVSPKRKALEIDTEWVKSDTEVHQDDVKLILYPNESIFRILFPDGSGQIHYPSGNLAMLILRTKENKFTYIILDDTEDDEETCVRALINNAGHATFYDENREIWLSLSQNLGYYFAKGKPQKAWNWWDLGLHVHAPPVQPVSLDINQHIRVQVRSQDQVIFCFIHPSKHICLNMGTKYKFILPETLNEMKNKAVLEVEISSTAQKMQNLLVKMSKILNFLTICDLERFLEDTSILLMGDAGKSVGSQMRVLKASSQGFARTY